jgi:hypothetical protein
MIALQASDGLANDCGLCALKNVTVDDSFTLDETIGIARGLEEKLSEEVVRLGAAHKVHHLDADIPRTRTREERGHSTYAETARMPRQRAAGRGADAGADLWRTLGGCGRDADADSERTWTVRGCGRPTDADAGQTQTRH